MPSISTSDIKKGNLPYIKEHLSEDVSQSELDNLLLMSAKRGLLDITRFLVDKGANVNCRLASGDRFTLDYYYTPLHMCVDYFSVDHLLVMFYLLTKGASPRVKSGRYSDRWSLIDLAKWKKFYLIPVLILFYGLSFLDRRTWNTGMAEACPRCEKPLARRQVFKEVYSQVSSRHATARDVMVFQEYCTKCGHITNDDVFNDAQRRV